MKTFRYIFDKFCKSIVTKTDLQQSNLLKERSSIKHQTSEIERLETLQKTKIYILHCGVCHGIIWKPHDIIFFIILAQFW